MDNSDDQRDVARKAVTRILEDTYKRTVITTVNDLVRNDPSNWQHGDRVFTTTVDVSADGQVTSGQLNMRGGRER
jgi:hypothetical protein